MNTHKCISDSDLGRLLEGDVTQQDRLALQQHIEACPDCKTRWQRVSAAVQHMETALSEAVSEAQAAGPCLSEDMLCGFIGQALDPEDRGTAEAHLSGCSLTRLNI